MKSPIWMLRDKLSVFHQNWTNTTLDIESDMNPLYTDTDLDKDQISDNTSKNYELGQTTNMCVRPIMLPMITNNHMMTETSCPKSKNYFHTGPTKRIFCRRIVLFFLLCCLFTFLYFVFRAFSYLKSYNTQNWDDKMLENPIKKIECYFQKCRKIFRR